MPPFSCAATTAVLERACGIVEVALSLRGRLTALITGNNELRYGTTTVATYVTPGAAGMACSVRARPSALRPPPGPGPPVARALWRRVRAASRASRDGAGHRVQRYDALRRFPTRRVATDGRTCATSCTRGHHATFSTAPTHQPLGSANAETTPARAPAAAADRTQRPDATCEGKNG